ncbi:MAG: hypothetical protein UDB11_00565 [Peptococcaceae bacterium]|nr:hypothetical protein [Peptococcaceae bacterium]
MKIKIEGLLPAVGSKPIYDWEIYVDGEPYEIKTLYDNTTFDELEIDIEPKKHEEEGEKMLNVEKYLGVIKSEIDEDACASKSCLIAKIRRGGIKQNCDRTTCRDCEDDSIDWLFSEYEPPLLKNGDNLKAGDWIMVRSSNKQDWYKRQFMCFYNGRFYVSDDVYGLGTSDYYATWSQARLPIEGE